MPATSGLIKAAYHKAQIRADTFVHVTEALGTGNPISHSLAKGSQGQRRPSLLLNIYEAICHNSGLSLSSSLQAGCKRPALREEAPVSSFRKHEAEDHGALDIRGC